MIPVGTLCIVVRSPAVPHMLSAIVTVVPIPFGYLRSPFDEVVVESRNGSLYGTPAQNLRPIAPPGDPDRITTHEREPAELVAR